MAKRMIAVPTAAGTTRLVVMVEASHDWHVGLPSWAERKWLSRERCAWVCGVGLTGARDVTWVRGVDACHEMTRCYDLKFINCKICIHLFVSTLILRPRNIPSQTAQSTPPDPSSQVLELPPRQLPVVHSYTLLLVKDTRLQPGLSSRVSSFPGVSHLTPSGHVRHAPTWSRYEPISHASQLVAPVDDVVNGLEHEMHTEELFLVVYFPVCVMLWRD